MKVTLKRPQWTVFRSAQRFRVLAAGRRFGKTYLALTELCRAAWGTNRLAWYVAPTYRQVATRWHAVPYTIRFCASTLPMGRNRRTSDIGIAHGLLVGGGRDELNWWNAEGQLEARRELQRHWRILEAG